MYIYIHKHMVHSTCLILLFVLPYLLLSSSLIKTCTCVFVFVCVFMCVCVCVVQRVWEENEAKPEEEETKEQDEVTATTYRTCS